MIDRARLGRSASGWRVTLTHWGWQWSVYGGGVGWANTKIEAELLAHEAALRLSRTVGAREIAV